MGLILGAEDIEAGRQLKSTHLCEKMQLIDRQYPDGTTGAQRFLKMDPPRIIQSHLGFELHEKQLERYPNAKIIYVMRNPKDMLVSYMYHYRGPPHLGQFIGTWDQFFELAMKGKLYCGDLFDFISKWYKFNQDRENSLILKYEDMKKDPRGHVIKIARFMGHDISNKVVEYILQKTSLPVMIDEVNSTTATKTEDGNFQGLKLVRKGEVGDWVNYFSKQQSDLLGAKCKEYFEPLGLTFEYSA